MRPRIARPLAALLLFGLLAGTLHMLSGPVQRMLLRSQARRAIIQALPQERLHQLVLSENAFAALDFRDGGKEFVLRGAMHDIVRVERSDGQVHVWSYLDERETLLAKEIDGRVQRETDARCPKDRGAGWILLLGSWADGTDRSAMAASTDGCVLNAKRVACQLLEGNGPDRSPPPRG